MKDLWTRATRTPSGCLEWHEHRCKDGYGKTRLERGKSGLAHRAAWELAYGPIPAGHYVLHRCDNPPCIEPTHLFVGTQAANMADMVAKGRANRPTGERNGRARLSAEKVAEIRALYATGAALKDIAGQLSVPQGTVYNVANRVTWRHLP